MDVFVQYRHLPPFFLNILLLGKFLFNKSPIVALLKFNVMSKFDGYTFKYNFCNTDGNFVYSSMQ